ncbi:Hypothetical protein LOCK908_2082 [Lacticaseibacillus rhamnosus LOCK908]|nr:Hypothetical protein LOCK908_2082 [Lacticaseibacillus rhamnosus LOCK908]
MSHTFILNGYVQARVIVTRSQSQQSACKDLGCNGQSLFDFRK